MNTSIQKIAVTLCCSDEDLARVRPLADTLQSEALEVHVCAGVDLDARALERHMAGPRVPGVFVLCESQDLDSYQLPQLEERFEEHRGEHDQLVRVNIEEGDPEELLESIRATLARLAGGAQEETTLTANMKKEGQSEDLAEAFALARALVEANAAKRKAEAEAGAESEAEAEAESEAEAQVEAGAEAETEAQPKAPIGGEGGGRLLPWVAAGLALLVGAGLVWFAWDSGMFGQGASAPPEAAAAADPPSPGEPSAATDAAPEDLAEPPEDAPAPAEDAPDPSELLPPDEEASEEPASTDSEATPDEPPTVDDAPAVDDTPAVTEAPKLGEIREHDGLLVAPVSDTLFSWRDASNHCRLNKRGGKGGWRLTSLNQLKQLRKAGMLGPGAYWSTTLAVVGGKDNLVLDTTETGSRPESKTEFKARAQCVRAR